MTVPAGSTRTAGSGPCLLCGVLDDPTVEHIIPQTLWNRFGIDPDCENLAQFRTTLCEPHNQATSALHRRIEMMELIETGEHVTRKTLQQPGRLGRVGDVAARPSNVALRCWRQG
jgi:hypothetical protein